MGHSYIPDEDHAKVGPVDEFLCGKEYHKLLERAGQVWHKRAQ